MNIREQYAAARKAAQEIHAKATAEGRVKTEAEQAEFDAHVAKAQELKAQIDRMDADAAAVAAFVDAAAAAEPAPERPSNATVRGERRSPGEMVVASAEYKAMLSSVPRGSEPPAGTVIGHIGSFRNAVTITETTTPPLYVTAPVSLSIVDIFNAINVVENAPDAIKIFRTSFTNNAAVVAPGSTKPESTLVITPDTVNPEVIAHVQTVNNQQLWHNALLANLIDVTLVNGVRAKAQAEVATTLLSSVALMQQQAFDTDLATTLRKAITKAQRGALEIGGSSNLAIAMSPEDHEKLDLELLDAMVALAGQELQQTGRIWRSTIVPLYGLTPGVAFVGDLKQVSFYISKGISLATGLVNDQFLKNQLTIRAEMEAKAAVIGGAALVATDLDGSNPPDLS